MSNKTLKSLQRQIALFQTIINHANAVIGAKDLDGRYIFVNEEYSRLFHIDQEKFVGQTDHDIFPHDIAKAFRKADQMVLAKDDVIVVEEKAPVDGELRDYLSVKFPIHNNEGMLFATGLVATDITERKKTEVEIQKLALTDYLTQLPNRVCFTQRLDMAIKRAKRLNTIVGLAILDLDDFKPINDIHGHLAGDIVLKEVSKRLLSVFREVDTVARFGGDEFAIILDSIVTPNLACEPLERAVQLLQSPILVEGNEVKVGASAGIVFFPTNTLDSDELIRMADNALYTAKKAGKNKVKIYGEI